MASTVGEPLSTACITGSTMRRARRATAPSSVAEKSIIWMSWGTWRRIHSTGGRKPRSAMRSASSTATTRTPSRPTAPRRMRSIRRPGVATSTSTPRRNSLICGSIGAPPYTTPTRRPTAAPSGCSSAVIWAASSRVGARTRPAGCRELPWPARTSIGMPKAIVLPEPVSALPVTSRPARASLIVSAWMGKGVMMPWARSAVTMASGTPRASKVCMGVCCSLVRRVIRPDGTVGARVAPRKCRSVVPNRSSTAHDAPPPGTRRSGRWSAPVSGSC